MKRYLYGLAFLIYLCFFACSDDSSTNSKTDQNDLAKLEIKYINGSGYSNLMPPNLPDPVNIRIDLQIKNNSDNNVINELYFEDFKVYLANDSLLGKIKMTTWFDIDIKPSSIDTITLSKNSSDTLIFETPCTEYIYLDFEIKDKSDNFLKIKTDSIYYECVY